MGMSENLTAEILCVGTELLLGDIVNTNAAFLSQRLADLGISVYHHSVVGDNPERLAQTLGLSLSRADIVITSGGLGPTKDDLTKETVAKALGLPMELDERSLEYIRAYFKARGKEMTENNKKQAMMPRGAVVFRNRYGTAPALAVKEGEKTVIMLPGPPNELIPIFNEEVAPYLRERSSSVIVSKNVHLIGIGESALAELIDDILVSATNPTIAPYCSSGEVRLRVSAKSESYEDAVRLCDEGVARILQSKACEFVYGVDVGNTERALVQELKARGLTLSVAESCTGGLMAKRITDISGCSDVFLGGCVTYTNEMKQTLLGVSGATLAAHTAVSAEVAMEMARGVRERTGSDVALSATGIAGPGGDGTGIPVGTVYIGMSTHDGDSYIKLELSPNKSREYIRQVSATNAYHAALKYLSQKAPRT